MLLVELQPLAPELFWILCLALAIAFLLAFSVGANDVSNSFGTSVGSRVLTVTQACMLATVFEVAGATLLGYSVCDTFRRNMYDVSQYDGAQKELMLGALACLIGSASWNMIATALKMPISGTHSIVGATLGFSIVLRGWSSIKWMAMLRIVISWFASPILSGCIASLIYLLISKTVISKVDPLKYGLKALPLFYGATIFINVASIVFGGPAVLGLDKLVWYESLSISLLVAGAVICGVAIWLVPRMRQQITDELVTKVTKSRSQRTSSVTDAHKFASKPSRHSPGRMTTSLTLTAKGDGQQAPESAFDNVAFKPDADKGAGGELSLDPGKLGPLDKSSQAPEKPPVAPKPVFLLKRQQAQLEEIDLGPCESGKDTEAGRARPGMIRGERLEVFRLFSSLQILTACFASFAHGTNDVSNAVAPIIPIWNIYTTGKEDIDSATQVWILFFGGIGICTGLWAWGRAVMGTVGDGLTQLTPSKGFSIELGAAISVLAATKLGLPISTTHCKVGSVVLVGLTSATFCSQDNLLDMSETERMEASERKAVDWALFGNIALTWVVTVPLAAIASALVMLALEWMLL